MDDFPSLGTKGTGTRNNNLILPTVSTTSSGDQLQADQSTEDEHPKTRAQRHAETEALREAQEKRQGMKAIETWGLLPAELRECYLSVQETLQPMPSGHDGHGQIVTGPPMTLPSQSSRVDDSASPVLRGPPPGIDTSCKSSISDHANFEDANKLQCAQANIRGI
jgi:predicted acyl esterase